MSIIGDVLTGGISDFEASNILEAPYTVMEEVEVEDDATRTTHASVDPPCVGMVFESEPATYSFYNDYARFVGFGIRRRFLKRSKLNNDLIGRTYVCSKEGNKHVTKGVENPRPNTRTGCKAMLKAKRIENGKWVLLKFIQDHNHDLEPQCSRFFRSQKMMNTPEKNLITTLRASGIPVPKIMKVAAKQSGGVRNLSFTDKDCRNFCEKEQRAALSAGDAHVVLDFFVKMQLSNPRFFYSLELDETRTLRNVFWIDSRSRMAYAHFGDVITFDTTYLTNKYALKFAPFVGVNHHGQSTLLGCALLTDETIESFVWVFKTWLIAMEGKAPKAIITDQAASIKAALKEVFPESRHRFCIWHIMKKVPEKLGSVCKAHPSFMYKFDKCIYDSLTIKEFEERWESLTVTYGLVKHEWLVSLYECHSQWVPVFLKDTFFAGMSSSQRSESVNSLFDGYVKQNTCLKDFAVQYNLASEKRYDDEEHADFQGRQGAPHLKTTSPFEAQMAPLYTLEIFKKFQDEILAIPSCRVLQLRPSGDSEVHEVMELMVKKNGKNGTKNYDVTMDGAEIKCICRLFEFKGYLCRHAMVVLFTKGVYAIPQSYILKRWTRDARKMDTFDDGFKTLKENSREYLAMCFNDLCFECMKFAEKGSSSKERYMVAKSVLKEAFEKLSSMDDHVQTSKEGYQVETVMPNIIIRDPQASTSTRRQKRIKSGVEVSNEKKKERLCSNCKNPGHTITKCPEPRTKSMKVNSLNIESEKYMEHVDVEGLCGNDISRGH